MQINIRADLKPLQRAFVDLRAKQAPFATALALTSLAKGAQGEETKAITDTFETPTPFTQRAVAITPATKVRPIATVFIKDATNDKGGQAAYLEPYILGGTRSLGGKRAMLAPRGVGLNQYGNLSKGQLARLKAKPDVFVGRVTFRKSGRTVAGVFQRGATPRGERHKGDGSYGTRGKNTNVIGGVRTTLKLLIEFEDTTPVRKHLPFVERAEAYVRRNAAREFDAAMRKALATARR